MSLSNPQDSSLSRRRFFQWTSSLAATLGAAPLLHSAEAVAAPVAHSAGEDYYEKLGVEKIINAAGTYTTLTAACMPPQVVSAVKRAALHPVRLHDLQTKSGEYLAQRLKCEGAVVTIVPPVPSPWQPLLACRTPTATVLSTCHKMPTI